MTHATTSQIIEPRLFSERCLTGQEQLFIPFFVLSCLQLLDFALTMNGVHLFGLSMEGNPLVRLVIVTFGPLAALALIKSTTLLLIFFLFQFQRKVTWIQPAIWAMNGIYLLGAIVPWLFLLNYSGIGNL